MALVVTLVSVATPDDELVARVCAAADLGPHEVVGRWADGDPLVEVVAPETVRQELLVQVFRPRVVDLERARRSTTHLGLAPPLDAEGRCALTDVALSATASEEEHAMALRVVAGLAAGAGGYVLHDGELVELVELEGVPAPERVEPTGPPPPRPVTWTGTWGFVLVATPAPTPDTAGWRRMLGRVRVLADDRRDLLPDLRQVTDGWDPLDPGAPAPERWPMPQVLARVGTEGEEHLEWEVSGVGFPGDRWGEVTLSGPLPVDEVEAVLPRLLSLPDTDYGVVHLWNPADEVTHGRAVQAPGGRPRLDVTRPHERLPGLFWAQVLGPPFVELFGRDRLASTPAHRVEEIAEGRWLVQLTDHLADVVDDHDEVTRVRMACQEHLGPDCFFSPERGLSADYRGASISTLVQRGTTTERS